MGAKYLFIYLFCCAFSVEKLALAKSLLIPKLKWRLIFVNYIHEKNVAVVSWMNFVL